MALDKNPVAPRTDIKSDYFRVFTYQDFGRIPDIEFGYWPQTIRRWLGEGLDLEIVEIREVLVPREERQVHEVVPGVRLDALEHPQEELTEVSLVQGAGALLRLVERAGLRFKESRTQIAHA